MWTGTASTRRAPASRRSARGAGTASSTCRAYAVSSAVPLPPPPRTVGPLRWPAPSRPPDPPPRRRPAARPYSASASTHAGGGVVRRGVPAVRPAPVGALAGRRSQPVSRRPPGDARAGVRVAAEVPAERLQHVRVGGDRDAVLARPGAEVRRRCRNAQQAGRVGRVAEPGQRVERHRGGVGVGGQARRRWPCRPARAVAQARSAAPAAAGRRDAGPGQAAQHPGPLEDGDRGGAGHRAAVPADSASR